jgi:lantibiotic modifying enzyme
MIDFQILVQADKHHVQQIVIIMNLRQAESTFRPKGQIKHKVLFYFSRINRNEKEEKNIYICSSLVGMLLMAT